METNAPQTPPSPDGSQVQDNPVQDSPVQDSQVQDNPVLQSPVQHDPFTAEVSGPARPKGPNASAVVLGLVALLLAGLIIANETMGLRVDWSRLGPGAITGIGLLLVVLGAIGLVRRHDDV